MTRFISANMAHQDKELDRYRIRNNLMQELQHAITVKA